MKRTKVDRSNVLSNKDLIEEVDVINLMEQAEADELKPEPVINYESMTKEQLITVLNAKDTALGHYEFDLRKKDESHTKELEEMNKYYSDKFKELKALIAYYERKLKLLKDLLSIEKGE